MPFTNTINILQILLTLANTVTKSLACFCLTSSTLYYFTVSGVDWKYSAVN